MTKEMEVQDKKSEFRALVNNILTFMILAVMTWVGVNITQMKDGLATIQINDAIAKVKVQHLEEEVMEHEETLEEHLDDCEERWKRVENKLDNMNRKLQ